MLTFLPAYLLATWVSVSAMAFAARLARVPFGEVVFGFGPRLARWKFSTFELQLRLLPLGGYVTTGGIHHLPLLKQLALALSGNAVLVALAVVLLRDFGLAGREFIATFPQLLGGTLAPSAYGAPLLSDYMARFAEAGFAFTLAVVSLKLAAVNLMPLPTANGGQALLALVNAVRKIPEPALFRLHGLSLLMALPIVGIWFYVFFRWAVAGG